MPGRLHFRKKTKAAHEMGRLLRDDGPEAAALRQGTRAQQGGDDWYGNPGLVPEDPGKQKPFRVV